MYLQKDPKNKDVKRVFIAATRQNDGKTTTCLGLYAALQTHFKKMGYIKPIGQRFIKVGGHTIDEDSFLFDQTFDINIPLDAMSPVAITSNFTRDYINNPDNIYPTLVDKVSKAFDRTSFEREMVIIEGSGHAGVGHICDLSNAHVAKILGSKVIIVARGGIGQPVDEIALNKSLFDKLGVEVIGAILNKIDPDKMGIIQNYTRKALERIGVPLLGAIPISKALAFPNLSQVSEVVNGRWLNGQKTGRYNRISQVIVGAMTAKGLIDYIRDGVLVITPGDREDLLLLAIAANGISNKNTVSGIILTRNILPNPHIMEMIAQTNIPVVISSEESYAVASKINSMTVKTQPEDEDKIPLIKKLVLENVNLEKIIKHLD